MLGFEALLHEADFSERKSLWPVAEGKLAVYRENRSIMLDGRLMCACLVLGPELEGRAVETIEGMANGEELHPLQRQFLEHAALQCGVCTPGFLVAAKDLLDRNPEPTDDEVRYWLAGNLCRCTGYDKILRAVHDAAADLRSSSR